MSARLSTLDRMDAGTREMIERSLAVRSVAATQALSSSSLCAPVSYAQVDSIRRQMEKDGTAGRRVQGASVSASLPGIGLEADIQGRGEIARHSRALLHAMLRAGQHLLTIDVARALAAAVDLPPSQVRAAAGDPTTMEGQKA